MDMLKAPEGYTQEPLDPGMSIESQEFILAYSRLMLYWLKNSVQPHPKLEDTVVNIAAALTLLSSYIEREKVK